MITLNGHALQSSPIGDLKWKRDLVYFEGPLLSEYTSNKSIYLKYWCDCDNDYNRWLIYKIKESDRLRLVGGEKSIYETIIEQPDLFVLFCDENDLHHKLTLCELNNIPSEYMPEPDSYLDICDYQDDLNIISMVFENEWAFDDLKTIYHKFTQIYDFIFAKNKINQQMSKTLPWHDGFSSMHFYNSLKDMIPLNQRSRLDAIHYASPGYLKIHSDENVTSLALDAINHYLNNKNDIDDCYFNAYGRIRSLEINKMSKDDAITTFNNDPYCRQFFTALMNNLHIDDNTMHLFSGNLFDQCKILMAHCRRLQVFHSFLEDGKVRIISPLIKKT